MAILTTPPQTGAHFYTREGKPMHQVQLADKSGTRPTTLADARQLGLFPSVSAILSLVAKPGLEVWKQQRVAEASLSLKRHKKESEEYFIKRIVAAAEAPVREAGDFGSDIHAEIERFFRSLTTKEPFASTPKLEPYCAPTINWIIGKGYEVTHPEHPLVNLEHGFGGTTDFPFRWRNGQGIGVIDFKSRKTKAGVAIEAYETQVMQIAAYAGTFWGEAELARCWGANIFISSTEPGRTELVSYSPAMMLRAWTNFLYLCHLWREFNQYDPRYAVNAQPEFPASQSVIIATVGGDLVAPAAMPAAEVPDTEAANETNVAATDAAMHRVATEGVTYLQLLEGATLHSTADGMDFQSPRQCCEMSGISNPPKTSYAWWYNAETNAGLIGLRGDAALREHGCREAFLAYPKNLDHLARAAVKPAPKPVPAPKATGRAQAAASAKLDLAKARSVADQLEATSINFGRYKGQKLGDLDPVYLDWVRGQPQILAVHKILRAYLDLPHINQRVDRALKRAGK